MTYAFNGRLRAILDNVRSDQQRVAARHADMEAFSRPNVSVFELQMRAARPLWKGETSTNREAVIGAAVLDYVTRIRSARR